jgi:hypothetical protein
MIQQGTWPARTIPIGKNIPLGTATPDLSKLAAPGAYKLLVGLEKTTVENGWNFWVYPAASEVTKPAEVTETDNWVEAAKALGNGAKVLFTPKQSDLDPSRSPAMKRVPVFWNIQMTVRPPRNNEPKFDAMLGLLCTPKHPALAHFPTEGNCDWQWTPLVDNVRSINLSEMPIELKPIVAAIDDWNRNWRLGVLFECKAGNGRLMVCAIPLPASSPGARQLHRSILDYMGGDKFAPPVSVPIAELQKLWLGGTESGATPAVRKFDADLNDGSGAQP